MRSTPTLTVPASLPLSAIKPIHPFPARMAPSIAFDELPVSSKPLRVLDPMVGSGTTAVVARAKGHHAVGFDSDPLAVMLSSAWCYNARRDSAVSLATDVLAEAKLRYKLLSSTESCPAGCDDATRDFVKYWFDRRSRLQLRSLADAIGRPSGGRDKAILWCGFSRLIIAKSRGASLAMDLSHSRPHKVFETAPIEPFDEFLNAVKRVADNMPFKGASSSLPAAQIKRHDARKLPLDDSSIDFVITSPPYLNAIDYVRCSKFTLVWMGHKVSDLQQLRSENIGSERSTLIDSDADRLEEIVNAIGARVLHPRHKGMLKRYVKDLSLVLSEIARVLVPKGRAVFVVGDSTLDGVFIRNSEILRVVGMDHGLKLTKKVSRDLLPARRYLPPPDQSGGSTELAERMRKEVIMHFQS
jgi:DNA modification methylase